MELKIYHIEAEISGHMVNHKIVCLNETVEQYLSKLYKKNEDEINVKMKHRESLESIRITDISMADYLKILDWKNTSNEKYIDLLSYMLSELVNGRKLTPRDYDILNIINKKAETKEKILIKQIKDWDK